MASGLSTANQVFQFVKALNNFKLVRLFCEQSGPDLFGKNWENLLIHIHQRFRLLKITFALNRTMRIKGFAEKYIESFSVEKTIILFRRTGFNFPRM